jgi:hypothetical protein
MRHQPVEPGDATVGQALDAIAHGLRHHRGLLDDGEVRGARRDHRDQPDPGHGDGIDHGDAGQRVKAVGDLAGGDGVERRGIGPGGQNILMVPRQMPRDGNDLLRRLARAEDGLGTPVAQRAMEIEAGEAEVGYGKVAELPEGVIRGQGAAGHVVEERLYFLPIHRRTSLALPLRKPWRSRVTK